jgi:hypothetical protein
MESIVAQIYGISCCSSLWNLLLFKSVESLVVQVCGISCCSSLWNLLLFKSMESLVQVYGMRLCLWTAATSGSVVHPAGDIWVWRATMEWYWQGKTEELRESPVPMPLCSLQVLNGETRARETDLRAVTRLSRGTTWHCVLLPSYSVDLLTLKDVCCLTYQGFLKLFTHLDE